MIAKELNAALSDDKVREQWLKRILPALVVTVIYFVFISTTLTEKADKAEQSHMALMGKGISDEALPGIEQQNLRLKDDLAALKKKDADVQASLSAKAGFLYGQNNMNEAVGKIAQIMQNHHLRIIEELSVGDKKINELPRSFADLKKWLGEMLKTNETVHVHRIHFIGAYVDVYEAMKEMAQGDVKALPLFLSMKNPDTDDDKNIGMKAWTLDLWI